MANTGTSGTPANPDPERVPPSIQQLPSFIGQTPSRLTLQLFGCYVVDQRRQARISFDVFARAAVRSDEWLSSVERGACAPSPRGFAALERGFHYGGADIDAIDLGGTYQRLDAEPFGDLAGRLRIKFGLQVPSKSDSSLSDPDGMLPLLQTIRFHDRLLTITPLILLTALIGVFWAGRPWRGHGIDLRSLDFGAISFVALGVIAFASLVMPTLSRLLLRACERTRFGDARVQHRGLWEYRSKEQVPLRRSLGWSAEEELPFLVPESREEFSTACLELDLYERLILVLGAGTALYLTAVLFARNANASISSWIPWAVAAGLTLAATIASIGRRAGLSRRAAVVARDAYGVRLISPSPSPPSASVEATSGNEP